MATPRDAEVTWTRDFLAARSLDEVLAGLASAVAIQMRSLESALLLSGAGLEVEEIDRRLAAQQAAYDAWMEQTRRTLTPIYALIREEDAAAAATPPDHSAATHGDPR